MNKATQTDDHANSLMQHNEELYAEILRLRKALCKARTTPIFGVVGVVGLFVSYVSGLVFRFFGAVRSPKIDVE